MKLLTPQQLAEIRERHEALSQHYTKADEERGFHKGLAGAENQSHHDRLHLLNHITTLEAEKVKLVEQVEALDFSWELAKQRWHKAEATIKTIGELPDRWLVNHRPESDSDFADEEARERCANQLQALITKYRSKSNG